MTTRQRPNTENTPGNGQLALINDLGLGLDRAVVGYGLGSQNPKKKNEDSYWPHYPEDTTHYHAVDYLIAGRLYIVADGVSNGLSGDEASHLAVQAIATIYYEQLLQLAHYPTEDELERALRRAILQANQVLLNRSREQRRARGLTDRTSFLQTTIGCGLLRGQTLIIAYVGDSRLYRLSQGQTRAPGFEVTHLLPAGQVEDNQYFLGTNLQRDQIWIFSQKLAPDDLVLLCTDGLYKYLAPDNDPHKAGEVMAGFKRSYKQRGLEQMRRELLLQADDGNTQGGGDNITVMLVEPAQPTLYDLPVSDRSTMVLAENVEQAIERFVQQIWQGVDTFNRVQNELQEAIFKQLSRFCRTQAEQLAKAGETQTSAAWQRRAMQLRPRVTTNLARLEEAQSLVRKLGLDIEQNKMIMDRIVALHREAPEEVELSRLALEVTDDLANLALLEARETVNRKMMRDIRNALTGLYEEAGLDLAVEERRRMADTLQQLEQALAGSESPTFEEQAQPGLDPRSGQSGLARYLARPGLALTRLWPSHSFWSGAIALILIGLLVVALGIGFLIWR